MPDFPLLPASTALINVDMQNCFVEGTPLAAPNGLALVQKINELIQTCRETGTTVVHTRVWMARDGSNVGVMAELVPPFIVELYTAGSPTAELHPALDVTANDLIVDKTRYGAFHGTDLADLLRNRGIDTVLISGIATNICCETTAREAAQHDFRVVFLSDGTATKEMNGVPAADLHRATLANLGMVFAQIATVNDTIAKLRDADRPQDTTAATHAAVAATGL